MFHNTIRWAGHISLAGTSIHSLEFSSGNGRLVVKSSGAGLYGEYKCYRAS